jgi:hypothetical protein
VLLGRRRAGLTGHMMAARPAESRARPGEGYRHGSMIDLMVPSAVVEDSA